MTAQIPDRISIAEKTFSIAGINGSGLFDPHSIGITPFAVMTSCWRGYVCEYKVLEQRLILDRLLLSLGMDQGTGRERKFSQHTGPEINGIRPSPGTSGFNNVYEGLNLEVPFTGSLLAADGFIRELYVHMGFHPAWKYQTVFELAIEDGSVRDIRDVSKRMEQIRKEMSRSPDQPDVLKATKQEVKSWIEKTFRLDYDSEE